MSSIIVNFLSISSNSRLTEGKCNVASWSSGWVPLTFEKTCS